MKYSFFGTCSNDYEQFFGCLQTIIEQTKQPKQLILVNSGRMDIEKKILNKLNNSDIKLVYIMKKLNRVKSLNIAIDCSNSEYSFRYDTRSRFSKNYAENALKTLSDKSPLVGVVGGVPNVIPETNNFEATICSQILKRPYIFFYPKHKNIKYSGYSSSIYLGCFRTKPLKEIRFNEKEALISEDSLIIHDFLEKGFKAYLSSSIKLSYVSRSSFKNILKLFNTYGFCRANTIIVSRKIFISARHFFVFICLILFLILSFKFSLFLVLLLPLILLGINFLGEIISYGRKAKFVLPFYATLCQFLWISGILWGFISIFRNIKKQSNFIS